MACNKRMIDIERKINDFFASDECIEIDYNIDDYPELKYMQILKK